MKPEEPFADGIFITVMIIMAVLIIVFAIHIAIVDC